MQVDLDLSQADLVYREPPAPPVAPAALSLLVECGYDIADFVVDEEARSELALSLGLTGGLLRIQCRSTGEDRIYSTGHGSAWMASVLGDLDEGHFAGAVRSGRALSPSRRASTLARRATQQAARPEFADTVPDVRLPAFGSSPALPRRWGFSRSSNASAQVAVAAGFGSF